jgi:translation elongation factor EF-Tu-like GTPase
MMTGTLLSMANANLPHDKSNSDVVIAQGEREGKTLWLMRANDGQFYLRDSDENTEMLSPEDAEEVYDELPDRRVDFDSAFKESEH